jgi:WD40 repeat protein/serine/threonine protein kinase
MSAEQEKLNRIFSEALARRSAEERERYLQEVCGSDRDLRSQLDSLLKAHHGAGNFLRPLATMLVGDGASTAEGAGTVIGRYKLLQEIGEGGFGLVFMAEQREPVRRMVALKILKAGMDTKEVIARFEAERQALALMDHPNIARVLDGGTTASGRPYFVMDLVKGIPITEFCDQNQLSTEARLRLFMQVCAGVQHAHQKGIIHRDVKPSNVLVTMEQGEPVPKVIDFGIAKALGQKLTERTLFTRFEQLIGTPAYMSPEQAEWGGVDIDTRSDIYSLGALLYELLTGTTPFEKETLARAALDEVRRMIRETEPPTPSLRLQGLGQQLNEIARRRRAEPALLTRRVRGDLDWIVMKALDKDRTRRYETANGLAMDLQRHLANEPIVARPPSRLYELQKSVRRHKVGFAAAGVVAVALVLGVMTSTWEAIRARRAGRRAEQGEQRAKASELVAREAAAAARRNLYAADMNLAHQACQENNFGRAWELLNKHRPAQHEPDLRGWEWRYLWSLCHSEALYSLGRHARPAEGVFSLAISPDDKLLVSLAYDGDAIMWDIGARRPVETLETNRAGNSVAFSPDGRTLAFATLNHGVKLWDVQEHREISRFPATTHAYLAAPVLSFSPNGRQLAIGGVNGSVELWDLATRTVAGTLEGHLGDVEAVAFSRDGQRLVSGGLDRTVRVWSLPDRKQVAVFTNHTSRVQCVAFSPDGSTAASGSWDATIHIWDLAQLRQVTVLTNHTRWVSALAFSPNGKTLASASADYTIKYWETRNWQELSTLKGSLDEVYGIVFSSNGETLFSGTKDGQVLVWDGRPHPPETRVLRRPLRVGGGFYIDTVTGMPYCLHSTNIFTAWDPRTLRKLAEHVVPGFTNTTQFVWATSSREVQRTALATDSGQWYVWDVGRGRQIWRLPEDESMVGFSPNEKLLASIAAGKHLMLWDMETLEVVAALPKSVAGPACMCFTTNGDVIAVGNGDGTVELWNLVRKERVAEWRAHQCPTTGMAFMPDGKRLVTVSSDARARMWDLETQHEVVSLGQTLGSYWSVAISPDGQRIAAGTGECSIRIWDATTGQELLTLKGVDDWVNVSDRYNLDSVTGLAFVPPDGDSLISATQCEARLWRAPSWAEIEAAEKQAGAKPD